MNTSSLGICAKPSTLLARAAAAALAMAVAFTLAIIATPAAQAQTFQVIHNFKSGTDGAYGYVGLTPDLAGNFYGTAWAGGAHGYGTVFELKPSGSSWVFTTLYSFAGGNDGATPWGRVALAQDGTLYGTTAYGGQHGAGTVFHLTPPPTALAHYWSETVIHHFTGTDGEMPLGDLAFDASGNIFGTTFDGGDSGSGVVYELTPSAGGWTESVLYAAQDNGDGELPRGGVTFDRSGNLYGAFSYAGPYLWGAVYQLSPSGSGWTEQTVYGFTGRGDGGDPVGGLLLDSYGNLYGQTYYGGSGGGGTVFQLTPADGGWNLNTLYGFSGPWGGGLAEKPVMDAAGNLYGTTYFDGKYLNGSVFKLTASNGGWTYTSLHDFTGNSAGGNPTCTLVFDAKGNLYGTTRHGGTYGSGVIFQITP